MSVIKKNKLLRKQLKTQMRSGANASSQNSAMLAKGTKNTAGLISAPSAYGNRVQTSFTVESTKNPKYGGAIKVRGREYLQAVKQPVSPVEGTPLANVFVSPLYFTGTRLAEYAKIYEKFRFNKLSFSWAPAVGSSTNGEIVIAYDRDISDATPPASPVGVRQYMSFEDAQAVTIWAPCVAVCPLRDPETDYYTNEGTAGGDDRLVYQGQVYVAYVVPSSLATNSYLGSLFVDYECEFYIPQLMGDDVPLLVDQTVAQANPMSPGVNTGIDLGQVLRSSLATNLTQGSTRIIFDTLLGAWRLPSGWNKATIGAGIVNWALQNIGIPPRNASITAPIFTVLANEPAEQPLVQVNYDFGQSFGITVPPASASTVIPLAVVQTEAEIFAPKGGALLYANNSFNEDVGIVNTVQGTYYVGSEVLPILPITSAF